MQEKLHPSDKDGREVGLKRKENPAIRYPMLQNEG